MTLPRIDERLPRCVDSRDAVLRSDVGQRSRNQVDDYRAGMAVPWELRSWLHGVSDDDRPRRVLYVDDVGRLAVQLDLELQANVVDDDGARCQRLGGDRWWWRLRRSRQHVCAASH